MSETDWSTCADPQAMLDWLREQGKLSERKARLFCVACCRRVWHMLNDERSQNAVELVERWVDGDASRQELADAHELAWQAWGTPARTAASDASAVEFEARRVAEAASHAAWAGSGESRADERRAQANLLGCIFGNPFILLPPLDLAWLAWNDRTVVRLAQAIYDERRFEDMPILADALEDAGCAGERVFQHCREQGRVHVRGCWVVDLILGKS